MGQIIETITKIYDIISGCYFDHVESIIEAITTKEYYDIQEHDYCEKLLKLCKEFKGEHKKFDKKKMSKKRAKYKKKNSREK